MNKGSSVSLRKLHCVFLWQVGPVVCVHGQWSCGIASYVQLYVDEI